MTMINHIIRYTVIFAAAFTATGSSRLPADSQLVVADVPAKTINRVNEIHGYVGAVDDDGFADGDWLYHDDERRLRGRVKLDRGEILSIEKWWDNGARQSYETFVDGLPHGRMIYWNRSNVRVIQSDFVMGTGTGYTLDEVTEKVIRKSVWSEGRLVETIQVPQG